MSDGAPLIFDWTISLGNLITIIGAIGTVMWFLSALKFRLSVLEEDLSEIRTSLKSVSEHVVSTLVSAGRMQGLEERLSLLIRRVDTLNDRVRDGSK